MLLEMKSNTTGIILEKVVQESIGSYDVKNKIKDIFELKGSKMVNISNINIKQYIKGSYICRWDFFFILS